MITKVRSSRVILLVDSNNAIVWMVSTCPFISTFSSPFINTSVTIWKAPITIGITVTFMCHSFFNSQARSRYLSFFSHSFSFIIYSFRVFHLSVSWWFFSGVWVTASLLKFPGLVSGFWPFSAMQWFGWSLPVRQLPSPPGLLIIV